MNLNATILGQAISFVLFVLFCMKYVLPPIMTAIEKRQKEIAAGLSAAERAKKNLDLAKADASERLKKAKAEAKIVIEHANKQRVQIIEEAKLVAETERNKIIAQAKIDIDAERRRVLEELRKHVSMLAILGAEKIIERSVDTATHCAIVDKLVNEL
ncbi:MAG: F0F1 ATP synthase subunit B [Candidatus Arsenophonus melophagi]|nr:F0F1 ATP synthase subunit B [Candidatus Arsenophonus melophagi]